MAKSNNKLPSFEVNIAVLPGKGRRLKLEPTEVERNAIAEEAGIISVDWFLGELEMKRWRRNGVSVTGSVKARITQECVVTLEPIESEVEEDIDRTFLPEGSKLLRPRLSSEGELIIDYDGKDEPEMFIGENLDAWEIALEHFILGVDPYPRKSDAEFKSIVDDVDETLEDEKPSPFAALKGLIKPD
ncbi:MAG: DUF177 domain-containing protein [Salaquimonas sp.]